MMHLKITRGNKFRKKKKKKMREKHFYLCSLIRVRESGGGIRLPKFSLTSGENKEQQQQQTGGHLLTLLLLLRNEQVEFGTNKKKRE